MFQSPQQQLVVTHFFILFFYFPRKQHISYSEGKYGSHKKFKENDA